MILFTQQIGRGRNIESFDRCWYVTAKAHISRRAEDGNSFNQVLDCRSALCLNLLSSIHISINSAPASTVRIGIALNPLEPKLGGLTLELIDTSFFSLEIHGLVYCCKAIVSLDSVYGIKSKLPKLALQLHP